MIALIDYGAGNVGSVLKAIQYLGHDAVIADSPEQLERAAGLIFPGQGHFAAMMQGLAARRLLDPLRAFIDSARWLRRTMSGPCSFIPRSRVKRGWQC